MQLAIQKGLPFASRKQDFFRIPLRHSEADDIFRVRLWAYCVMVFQRYFVDVLMQLAPYPLTPSNSNSIWDGFPYTAAVHPNDFDRDIVHLNSLPSIISYTYRLHLVQTDSFSLILSSTDLVTDKHSDFLNALIYQFDSEAQKISPREDSDLG